MGLAHVRALIVVTVAASLVATAASAHEIGTTRVRVRFYKDHTFQIDVVTAPMSLLRKLEGAAGLPRAPQLPPTLLRQRLQAQGTRFASKCEIRFGQQAVHPRIEMHVDDYAADIRLIGEIPSTPGDFTWQYGWTYSSYVISMSNDGIKESLQWLEADQRSQPFALAAEVVPPTRMQVMRQYLLLGFTHIVPYGLDHILFVTGIFLLTTKLRPILIQVTAFTIAHSITLGLTIYGLVSLSPRILEPAIALSIAYVAIENVTTSELKPWRVAIVFAFGLLHGMGFAGVLKELGLPRSEFLTALVTFNLGVEAGQLTVIAVIFCTFSYWFRSKTWYRTRFVVPASILIACIGIFWTVQRIVA